MAMQVCHWSQAHIAYIMLRLNEIKLPLAHSPADLTTAAVERLGIEADQLRELHVFKRSYDARRKSQILLIY